VYYTFAAIGNPFHMLSIYLFWPSFRHPLLPLTLTSFGARFH